MLEVLTSPPVESPKMETPGLAQTRQLIQRYRDIVTSTQSPNLELVNRLVKRNGSDIKQLVKDTIPGSIARGEMVVRSDSTNILLDKLTRRGGVKLAYESPNNWDREKVEEEAKEFDIQTVEQRVNQDLEELEEVLQFQQYVNQTIEKTDAPFAYKQLQQKISLVTDMYKESALYSLLKRGDELFAEDILGQDVPRPKEGVDAEHTVGARNLANAVKAMMIATDTHDELREQYGELERPLRKEEDSFHNSLGTNDHYKIRHGSRDLLEAIKEFSDWVYLSWENLEVTPEQTRKIYDIVHTPLLKDLFAGGDDSHEGNRAATVFSRLGDPRALPYLIDYLRQFGSGHTSNLVIYSIRGIVKNPLDEKDLEQVIAQANPFQRRVLNNWFIDSSRADQKILDEQFQGGYEGYQIARMVQAAESHLTRGDLVNIASDIAKSQNQEIDWKAMRAFFPDHHHIHYIDSSWVENILLGNLDKVGTVIAKSKIVDWRLSSQRLFNALISPADGQFSKFPKLIALEGLGLGQEDLERIEKLYQSGDLRRGVMSRAAFAEGLLFLSSKDEGTAIMKDILAASTGANRDSERIRDIFSLLRSLDSFGGFEFIKRANLNEIASNLKGKLVTVVGEKMELTEAEGLVLNERIFDLMKTGVFEIIPHLLARFHEQGKEDVARVVIDIGKHIVLGDFKEWRNTLDTALSQLSVLPQEKQANWTNPGPEVSLEIGMTTGTEAKRGALDAIKRIASEAKAHVLDVYKLDFSQSGINLLKQKQQDLIRTLKDTKDHQERRDLGASKRGIDDQLRVIEGILGLENLSIDNLDPIQLTRHVASIINSITSFQGLDQAATDLSQITEVLTTQAEIGNVTKLRIFDTDDPMALLKVGIEPRETCQSYRSGSFNYCLPAYVADVNKRVINVESDKGEVLGRAVMKLTHVRDDNDQTHPAILLEPIYSTSEIAPIYRGVVKIALEKAKAIGAYLILTSDIAILTGANHERTIPVVETECKKMGLFYGREDVNVFIPKSVNSYEYSDSLGGPISYFEIYYALQNAVVVRP